MRGVFGNYEDISFEHCIMSLFLEADDKAAHLIDDHESLEEAK
jgi:hypothetical protein